MKIDVDLAPRQKEVAEHIGFGYSIKETSNMIDMPMDTVKSTLKAIYRKLGIQKATELSKYIYCKKFNIPLSMCEPTKKILAIFFLCLFLISAFDDQDLYRRGRRSRRTNHRVERIRKK